MGRMNRRVLVVTNTPTPYRNFTFQQLGTACAEHSVDLDVWFMSSGDAYGRWRFSEQDLPFKSRIFGGPPRTIRGVPLHFAPRMLAAMARESWDVTVVGGYAAPALLAAGVLARLRSYPVLWTEGNLTALRRTTGLLPIVKRLALEQFQAFVVPQQATEEMVVALAPKTKGRQFIRFPNLVDASVFGDGVALARAARADIRRELGLAAGKQLWLVAARLSEEKGLHELMRGLVGIDNVRLVLAGDGPLRDDLERLAASLDLDVNFRGQCDEGSLVRLLGAADIFVLPSRWDSSPLAPIEASCAGLPLLLSERVGNAKDLLISGVNGWSFDPLDETATRSAFQRVASLSDVELKMMGRRSRAVYDERFDARTHTVALARALWELASARTRTGQS